MVQIYDVYSVTIEGLCENKPAVVMEWLDGSTLETRLAGEPLSLGEVQRICADMIGGLAHLHSVGVAHGDFHPANLFLCSDGELKIIDARVHDFATLGGLTSGTVASRVNDDIGYVRLNVSRMLRHARVPGQRFDELEGRMASADTLADLRTAIVEFFTEPQAPPTVPRDDGPSPDDPEDFEQRLLALIDEKRPAILRRYVMERLRSIAGAFAGPRFTTEEIGTDAAYLRRVEEYESLLKPVLPGLISGAFHGGSEYAELWGQCVEKAANCYEEQAFVSGPREWFDLRVYPPLVALYAVAFGAFVAKDFPSLRHYFCELTYRPQVGEKQRMLTELAHWKQSRIQTDWKRCVPGASHRMAPISERLEGLLWPGSQDLLSERRKFADAFDDFEYFLALVESYEDFDPEDRQGGAWGPWGCFVWRRQGIAAKQLLESVRTSGESSPIIRAGFFHGSAGEFIKAIHRLEQYYAGSVDRYSLGPKN